MKATLVLCLMKVISRLPLGVARYFGRLMGAGMAVLGAKPFKVTQCNLAVCYPDQDPSNNHRLANKRMRHLGQAFFETPVLWRRSSPWLQSHIIAVEGESHLKEAIANDRGTVLLIPHLGNWEVIGLWVAAQTKMTSLFQPPKMPAFGEWIKRSREKTGANLVPTNVSGVAALLKALKRGETVAILPDQQPPKTSGDFAPLFGAQALTMTLTHNLLKRSDSQAIFCCALREKGGWRLHFVPADQAIYSDNQADSLASMNASIESIVAKAPEQYQWEYKRFRAQPDGSPAIYNSGV
ncbi:MAG: lysophospholipid acyltransferase family protein [Porticoccaceae bacterium]|nr:lysophospholipid acyltransferase family protein [Porticoccaceae bacterium]